MTPDDNPTSGLMNSLKRMLGTVAAVTHNRVELLMVELQEERARLVGLFVLAGAVIVLGLMTLVIFTLIVLLAAGSEHRLAAAICLGAGYLLATVITSWQLADRLKQGPLFHSTRTEIQKDRTWLEGKNPEH